MIPYLDIKKVNALHSEQIQKAMERVMQSGSFVLGEECRQFENEYARYIGTSHAAGCGNGLDALTLILMACKKLGMLKDGDEVIVPANTFMATILAVSRNRLIPVLADPDPDTFNLNAEGVERHVTKRTKAVIAVHLYGRGAPMPEIAEACRRHQLYLFEDNAQAHGCRIAGIQTGAWSDAAAHSFYPTKNLGALGDGGAVTTDNQEIAYTVKKLANYGSNGKNLFQYKGINSRLDEIQAAVLRAKLHFLDDDNTTRRALARHYAEGIFNSEVNVPLFVNDDSHIYHIFPILTGNQATGSLRAINRSTRRNELRAWLQKNGIATLVHYPVPPHRQECFPEFHGLELPVADKIAECELSLPLSPAMTYDEVQTVIDVINAWKR